MPISGWKENNILFILYFCFPSLGDLRFIGGEVSARYFSSMSVGEKIFKGEIKMLSFVMDLIIGITEFSLFMLNLLGMDASVLPELVLGL